MYELSTGSLVLVSGDNDTILSIPSNLLPDFITGTVKAFQGVMHMGGGIPLDSTIEQELERILEHSKPDTDTDCSSAAD